MARYKKGAARRRAVVAFVDESGLSLIPFVAKTWAPRGRTPILRHRFRWPKMSAISAVTRAGKLYFRLHPGPIKTPQVIDFLRHLLRHIRRPIVVLWDGHMPHRARATMEFLLAHPRIRVHRLPAYAPELNPDEWFWSYLKTRELPNQAPQDLADLRRSTRLAVMRIRRRPRLIASFTSGSALESPDKRG